MGQCHTIVRMRGSHDDPNSGGRWVDKDKFWNCIEISPSHPKFLNVKLLGFVLYGDFREYKGKVYKLTCLKGD